MASSPDDWVTLPDVGLTSDTCCADRGHRPSSPRAFEPYRGYEHGPEYDTDFREQPTAYRVGRDDGGPFEVEPHKSELPPLWEIKTAPETEQGAPDALGKHRERDESPGMDMARMSD
jgi:hypothetical protein